jgi:hypothetical protein
MWDLNFGTWISHRGLHSHRHPLVKTKTFRGIEASSWYNCKALIKTKTFRGIEASSWYNCKALMCRISWR